MRQFLLTLRDRKETVDRVGEEGGEASSSSEDALVERDSARERRLVEGQEKVADEVEASDEPEWLRRRTILVASK